MCFAYFIKMARSELFWKGRWALTFFLSILVKKYIFSYNLKIYNVKKIQKFWTLKTNILLDRVQIWPIYDITKLHMNFVLVVELTVFTSITSSMMCSNYPIVTLSNKRSIIVSRNRIPIDVISHNKLGFQIKLDQNNKK